MRIRTQRRGDLPAMAIVFLSLLLLLQLVDGRRRRHAWEWQLWWVGVALPVLGSFQLPCLLRHFATTVRAGWAPCIFPHYSSSSHHIRKPLVVYYIFSQKKLVYYILGNAKDGLFYPRAHTHNAKHLSKLLCACVYDKRKKFCSSLHFWKRRNV